MPRVRLDFMVEPRYTVKALDQSTWAAFAALVERNNGIFGGCWCLGFHPKESWTGVAQKRAAKEQRVREGKPTPRSFSTGRTASAGASSARPAKCPGFAKLGISSRGQLRRVFPSGLEPGAPR
jgi:hypothetical protein